MSSTLIANDKENVGFVRVSRSLTNLIPVQILEVGFNFHYYSIKGLELQETSCHTVEASRVDAVFSKAFDSPYRNEQSTNTSLVNPYFIHTLTAVTKIPVLAYTDTKNVLTGVIDSQDFLTVVPEYFTKALLFVMMDHIIQQRCQDEKFFQDVLNSSKDGAQPNLPRPNSEEHADRPASKTSSRRSLIVSASRERLSSLPKLKSENDLSCRSGKQDTQSSLSGPTNAVESVEHPDNVSNNPAPSKDDHNITEVNNPADESHPDSKSIQSGRGSRMAWSNTYGKNTQSHSFDWSNEMSLMQPKKSISNASVSKLMFQKRVSRHNLLNSNDLPPNHINKSQQHFVDSPRNVSPASARAIIGKNLPGFMFDNSDDDDDDKFEFEFNEDTIRGNNNVSLLSPEKTVVTKVNLRVFSRSQSPSAKYTSKMGKQFAPPMHWLDEIPIEEDTIDSLQEHFPVSWYQFLMTRLIRRHLRPHSADSSCDNQRDHCSSDHKGGSARSKDSVGTKKPQSAAEQKYGSRIPDLSTEAVSRAHEILLSQVQTVNPVYLASFDII